MSTTPSHRRVFGAGIQEGLRLAGITTREGTMNAARAKVIEQSLNSMAKKVLEAVPFDQMLSAGRIAGLMRSNGSNVDVAVVAGCLATLTGHGLVRQEKKDQFIRVTIKEVEAPKPPVLAEAATAPVVVPPAALEPLDRMARLAVHVRGLADSVRAVADEVEEVAIEVEERIKTIKGGTEKLAQLKQLLNSI